MKHKKVLYALAVIFAGIAVFLGILWLQNEQEPKLTPDEIKAEKIILSYIEAKNLEIETATEGYSFFMKGILLGEYPELTGENPIYGNDPKLREAIISYTGKHLDKKYKQPEGAAEPKPVPTNLLQPTN